MEFNSRLDEDFIFMLKRSIESTIYNVSRTFPILLLTGPRQVGKTTLLKAMAEEEGLSGHSDGAEKHQSAIRRYVSLDDLDARMLAQNDPALFLQRYAPPIIIDEIQYAPNLFSELKRWVDHHSINGAFWLTGSQKFHLMRKVTESLAGRVAILELNSLSFAEISEQTENTRPFLPTEDWLVQARNKIGGLQNINALYERIWLGHYPRIVTEPSISVDIFYGSYLQTYIQRDIKDTIQITNEKAFYDFIRLLAARTSQLLNYANIARDVGIDQKTVKAWVSVLEASGIIYLLQPYHNNLTNRLIKTPKIYFIDTGLCAFLTKWSSPAILEAGALSGAILETWVISELLKSYWYHGKTPHFYFYRDKDQKEIDLLIEQDNTLYPIEIKKTASPFLDAVKSSVIKNFSVLEKLNQHIGCGAVLCLRETDIPLNSRVNAIPVYYL